MIDQPRQLPLTRDSGCPQHLALYTDGSEETIAKHHQAKHLSALGSFHESSPEVHDTTSAGCFDLPALSITTIDQVIDHSPSTSTVLPLATEQ